MKSKRLLSAVGNIRSEYIEEAVAVSKYKRNNKKYIAVAVAACISIFVSAIIITAMMGNLQLLSVNEIVNDGMGFEGYLAYNIDELSNCNPWKSHMEIKKLPVYKNELYDNTLDGIINDPDTNKMKELLMSTAMRLSMDIGYEDITENIPEEYPEIYSYYVENDKYKAEVNAWLKINIYFKDKNALPDGYVISKNGTYNDMVKAATYIIEQYGYLFDMKNPVADISSEGYDIEGNVLWGLSFYEESENYKDTVLNYNFNRVYVSVDDEENIGSISLSYFDISDAIGSYPLISEEKAMELLLSGRYITSVTDEFPGEDAVEKAELIYSYDNKCEYFMPYYKFYVNLPDKAVNIAGKKIYCFGTYYVPAVEQRYIENMPNWNG